MGQVHPLPQQPEQPSAPVIAQPAEVRSIGSTTCALCGAKLGAKALRYHVVSPQSCETPITVCRTCRNATLSEGYRPAE